MKTYAISVNVTEDVVSALSSYYGYNPSIITESEDAETGGIIQTEEKNPISSVQFIADRVVSKLTNEAKEAMIATQTNMVRQGIEMAIGANPIQVNITEVG